MRKSNSQAIWAYDSKNAVILWGNDAAKVLWGVSRSSELSSVNTSALRYFQLYFSITGSFSLSPILLGCEEQDLHLFTEDNQHYDAEAISEGIYLITQRLVIDCSLSEYAGSSSLPAPLLDHNSLVSTYNEAGELLQRSDLADHEFKPEQRFFTDRFVDKDQALTVWQQLDGSDYFEGHFLTDNIDGQRWHIVQVSRIVIPGGSWIIQLRELDIDPFIQNEQALRNTLCEQEVIFEHAGSGICFIQDQPGKDREIVRCNRKFAEMYGYEVEELLGQNSSIIYPSIEEYKRVGERAYPDIIDGSVYSQRLLMKRKNGDMFWTQIHGNVISSSEPGLGYIWIVEDINERVEVNKTLESILNEQKLILDYAMVGIVFLKNRSVTRCNPRFEEMFGYESGELKDSSSRQWYLTESDWLKAGDDCYIPLSKGEVFKGEMLLRRKDNSPVWCEVRSKAIDPNDLTQGSIWITMDISERKAADAALAKAHAELEHRVEERTEELAFAVKELHLEIHERKIAEERVKHMALHDALTGLPNRILLEERLDNALLQAQQDWSKLAVLFIDLDRFKHINDSLGHHEGDQLLIEVSSRLHDVVASSDTVARLGGDEFVIVLGQVSSSDDVKCVIDKIQQGCQVPVNLALQEVYVTPSIGIALYPDDGTTAIQLMKNADAAMYHAKELGRNRAQFFNQGLDEFVQERLTLETALQQALQEQQFELYYQPQVDVTTNQIIGAEALIRWNHPSKGVIPPDAFIPLAEETGLIVEIGKWVLECACQQLAQWNDQGFSDFVVSVNLSALQVQQREFVAEVTNTIKRHNVDPKHIDLELTESMIMRNAKETISALDQLHKLGIQISVDDFGTGYSSLSYLKRFPLDKLKIDRSFVQDITADSDDAMICRTIISMAHNLNLKVIAEGVETQDQLWLLQSYGCELYQGYLYSRPVPASELTQHLYETDKVLSVT